MMRKLVAGFAAASMIVTMYAGLGYSSDKGAVVVEPVVLKKSALNNLLPKDAKKNSDTVTELDVIIYMEIFFIIIAFTEYFFMKIV
ncbi:hypothetical protein [Oribacterium sp. NK2B42]|uniref:hypothetical protein n=1 Tax=Oribacterium sp. NK2B42 TaxID=689781 RepID=UPI000419964D|nr:hypothetical protein [Oribacterium sp. NK2B42]